MLGSLTLTYIKGTKQYFKKELPKLRKALRNSTQEWARNEYFHTAPVLEVDRQIKQLLGESDVEDCDADTSEEDENIMNGTSLLIKESGRRSQEKRY